jgi:hypothetical protein
MFRGHCPLQRQPSGALVDPETRYRRLGAMADIQHLPVRADCQHRRPARDRHFGLPRKPAGLGIEVEGGDLVVILQANVQRLWHCSPSVFLSGESIAHPLDQVNTRTMEGEALQ